jgi:hypothetical protein
VENLGRLVIVRENDGVAPALEFKDCRDILFMEHPFGLGNDPADTVVNRGK